MARQQPDPPQESGQPRRRLARTLALVLGLLVLAAGGWALLGRSHAAAARRAVRVQDFDRAQHHIDRCLRLWPHRPSLLLDAARIARRRGDLSLAARHLESGRRRRPSAEGDLERLLLQAQRGELADVEKPLREMLAKGHRDEPLILEALAAGCIANGRFQEAKTQLDAILRKDPNHLPALLLLARVFASVPQADEPLSLPVLRRAVEVAPFSRPAHLALAQALLRRGHEREAAGHFELVRRGQPDLPEVLLGLAVCRFDAGERGEAARLLDHLLERHPGHPSGLVERGRLALFEGRPVQTEEMCRRALAVVPQDPTAWRTLALALEAQGRTREVEAALDAHCRIEGAETRLGHLAGALQESPDDPDVLARIGAAYLTLNQPARAERFLNHALAIDRDHAGARELLSQLRRRSRPAAQQVPVDP